MEADNPMAWRCKGRTEDFNSFAPAATSTPLTNVPETAVLYRQRGYNPTLRAWETKVRLLAAVALRKSPSLAVSLRRTAIGISPASLSRFLAKAARATRQLVTE